MAPVGIESDSEVLDLPAASERFPEIPDEQQGQPRWLRAVSAAITDEHRVTGRSILNLLDNVTDSFKESGLLPDGAAGAYIDDVDEVVASLAARVESLVQLRLPPPPENNNGDSRTSLLPHFLSVCRDMLSRKISLNNCTIEACRALDQMINNHFPLNTDVINKPKAIDADDKAEVLDASEEGTDLASITDEVNRDQRISSVEELRYNRTEEDNQLRTMCLNSQQSEVIQAADKLAECKEAMANLSKQLDSLAGSAKEDRPQSLYRMFTNADEGTEQQRPAAMEAQGAASGAGDEDGRKPEVPAVAITPSRKLGKEKKGFGLIRWKLMHGNKQ